MVGARYFAYGSNATDYLCSKDKRLGEAILRIGHVNRECVPGLFAGVVNAILGQQISTSAHRSVWARLLDALGDVTPGAILEAGPERVQAVGTTFRKAGYICDFARDVASGEIDLAAIEAMPDAQAIDALCEIKGIGPWTAEMLLLFTLERPDVLSFGDLAILRGMRMVYRKREITPDYFARVRRRLSPYGSVASLYFWEVSHGVLPDLTDPAVPVRKKQSQARGA